jgi:hypothetical protein
MRAGISGVLGWLPLAIGTLLGPAASGHAQESLSGAWQAGATTVEVAVDSWGKDCGPRPESMRSAGGGSVKVEQLGERLVIHAQGRVLESDRCASPNPAVRRISSARVGDKWTTRCRTDTKDPRQEVATYTLELLSADRLRYRDLSHFDWRLHDSTCKATITTTQLLERRTAALPGPATNTQPPKGGSVISVSPAATEAPPCLPGAPVRLSLRPARAELSLGARVCFEARVMDREDCPLPNPSVRYTLEHGPGIRAQLDGRCFRAAEDSAVGEGTFRVIATAGGLRDEARIVVSAEQLPSLIAARVQAGAIEGVPDAPAAGADMAPPAPPPAAGPAQTASRVTARAAAENEPASYRPALLALALLLVVTAVGFVLRRERGDRAEGPPAGTQEAPFVTRGTPATPPQKTSAAARAAGSTESSRPTLRCPRCGARFEPGNAFCGVDGERLVDEPEPEGTRL